MAIINQKHYLDIVSGVRAPVTIHVSQGDTGTNITFKILENGKEYQFSGESVAVHGTRRDGANFGPFPCTYSGSSVSFTTDASMTAVSGSAIAELSIVNSSGQKVGTSNFAILVENATFPDGVSYDTDPSVYEDILTYVQGMSSSMMTNAINSAKIYTDSEVSAEVSARETAIASEQAAREASDTALSNRISNLVVNAGGSAITEVVDARTPFSGSAKTALKDRLDLFLEYTVKSATEDI